MRCSRSECLRAPHVRRSEPYAWRVTAAVLRTGALALALAARTVAPASAQLSVAQPDDGFLPAPLPVQGPLAEAACILPLEGRWDDLVRAPTCQVLALDDLGDDGRFRWTAIRTRWTGIDTYAEGADSISFDQLVLLRSDSSTTRAVWRFETERTFWLLADVRARRRPEGLLIEALACLNGTGGCARDYLIARDGRLDIVEKAFATELASLLPDGLRLHKGVTLDLETLQGTWPVAAPGDANCCPSRMYSYGVELVGTMLRLESFTLR